MSNQIHHRRERERARSHFPQKTKHQRTSCHAIWGITWRRGEPLPPLQRNMENKTESFYTTKEITTWSNLDDHCISLCWQCVFFYCQAKNLSDCRTISAFHDFPRKIKEILLKIFQKKIVLDPGSKIELISSVIWITSDQVTMITNEAKILHFSHHTFQNI